MKSDSFLEPGPQLHLDGVRLEQDVMVPVRDGTHIAADIYLPTGDGPWPALYAVSPYVKDLAYLPAYPTFHFRETGDIGWFVRHGYAYVLADVRGTGKSTEGLWQLHDTAEQTDMYDTIEWIAAQTWCTGRVGMIGESYLGATQWLAAVQNPPHLTCVVPYDAYIDYYRDMFFHGGIWSQNFASWWATRTRARTLMAQAIEIPKHLMIFDILGETMRRTTDGPFYAERSAYWRLRDIRVPVYSIANWTHNALHLRGNVLGFEGVDVPKKLMIYGGTTHRASIDFFYSHELSNELLRWYDHWLKGLDNGIMDEPRVKVFERPKGGWRTYDEWPPSQLRQVPFFLGASSGRQPRVSLNDGRLSLDRPDDDAPTATSYSYPDPDWQGWPGGGPAVALEDGRLDPLAKILTFVTDPLTEPLDILGPVVLRLWASSDQADTEFYAKLADEAPDGTTASPAAGIVRGWLRASHRALDPDRTTSLRPFHTHRDPAPLQVGEVYRFDIEIWPTSWRFEVGHRIRLEISPGDSPVIDGIFTHEYGAKMGTDTFFHSTGHPSALLLPVVPSGPQSSRDIRARSVDLAPNDSVSRERSDQ